jgi:hypothetical protein
MLSTIEASKGLLFGSFLYRNDLFTPAEFALSWQSQFGKSFSLVPTDNPLSQYYMKEMEGPLSRVFFLTSTEFSRDYLLTAKLISLRWEKSLAKNNKRMVNIDIGFLTLENFLLATTKNYSHRVFIGQDIFADLTYYFHQGELQSLPWTYPDYLDQQKKDFFLWGRSFLLGLKK